MTEDEAKTKWCPMTRIHVFPDASAASNLATVSNDQNHCMCLGSGCMAWRWDRPEESPDGTFDADRHGGFVTKACGRKFIYHGHCGLAGESESSLATMIDTRK